METTAHSGQSMICAKPFKTLCPYSCKRRSPLNSPRFTSQWSNLHSTTGVTELVNESCYFAPVVIHDDETFWRKVENTPSCQPCKCHKSNSSFSTSCSIPHAHGFVVLCYVITRDSEVIMFLLLCVCMCVCVCHDVCPYDLTMKDWCHTNNICCRYIVGDV